MAATRNWYQCPVFNRSRIVACDFDETWRTIHGLDLDSRYLGPSKCRSSTKYLTPLIPVDSSIRCALELYQVKKTKLFFCCLIWTFLGITGKSEKKKKKNAKMWILSWFVRKFVQFSLKSLQFQSTINEWNPPRISNTIFTSSLLTRNNKYRDSAVSEY